MNILKKAMGLKKKLFYAVKIGEKTGIYDSWEECQRYTKGYSNATYKKFDSSDKAQDFMSLQYNEGESSNRIYNRYNSSRLPDPVVRQERPEPSFSQSWPSPSVREERPTYVPSTYVSPKVATPTLIKASSKSVATKDIYTDGASRGNGRADAVAGYGVYFGENDKRNVASPVPGPLQTNQRAELLAINHALTSIHEELKNSSSPPNRYRIQTDSQYAKNCFTKWAPTWKENDWKIEKRNAGSFKRGSDGGVKNQGGTKEYKDVSHKDIIQPGLELYEEINKVYREKGLEPLDIVYVKAHNGDPGNELADRLANEGADKLSLFK